MALFKRGDSLDETVSKIFERILFNQLQRFSSKFLSSLLRGFRKGYTAQYALINFLQKW